MRWRFNLRDKESRGSQINLTAARVSPHDEGAMGTTKQLLTRGSIYTVAIAFQLYAGLLVLPIITRNMDPTGYGELSIGLTVIQLLAHAAVLGIPAAITRFHFSLGGPENTRRLVTASGLAALSIAMVAHFTGPLWTQIFADLDYGPSLTIAVWAVVPFALMQACQATLRSQDRPWAFISVAGLSTVLGHSIGLILVWLTPFGAAGYLGGVAGGFALGAVLGTVVVRPTGLRFTDVPLLRKALQYGLPTVPHSVALFVLAAGDRIVVERSLGVGAVGRYEVAYLVGSIGLAILAAFNNAWAPMIYGAPESRRWAILEASSRDVLRIAAISAGGLAVLAPFGLLIAAPDSYDVGLSTPVSAIVALALIPYVVYLSSAHVIFHTGRTRVLAWATPVVACVNIVLNLVLIPIFGLAGAALATFVAYSIQAIAVRRAAQRVVRTSWDYAAISPQVSLGIGLAIGSAITPVSPSWLAARVLIAVPLAWLLFREIRRSTAASISALPSIVVAATPEPPEGE